MLSADGLKYLPFCEKCKFFRGCFYCANTPVYKAFLVRTHFSYVGLLDDSFPQFVCFLEREVYLETLTVSRTSGGEEERVCE